MCYLIADSICLLIVGVCVGTDDVGARSRSLVRRGIAIDSGVDMFAFFFSSRRRHTRFDCDWSSDVCSSDLGNSWQWDSAQLIITACAGVVLLIVFVFVERRAPEPILPLRLFRNRPFTIAGDRKSVV